MLVAVVGGAGTATSIHVTLVGDWSLPGEGAMWNRADPERVEQHGGDPFRLIGCNELTVRSVVSTR